MAEIEIHHEHAHHDGDPLAKRVGMMVGIVGILLAVTTILAHREHTAAVIHRTEANDAWAYYQAKKIRIHTDEVALQLLGALGADAARTGPAAEKLEAARAKFEKDAAEIKQDADEKQHRTHEAEALALRFDLGEGFLELGLVLSSLYFLGRQRLFPLVGGLSALLGLAIALSAFAL
jgi:hypothetical protein